MKWHLLRRAYLSIYWSSFSLYGPFSLSSFGREFMVMKHGVPTNMSSADLYFSSIGIPLDSIMSLAIASLPGLKKMVLLTYQIWRADTCTLVCRASGRNLSGSRRSRKHGRCLWGCQWPWTCRHWTCPSRLLCSSWCLAWRWIGRLPTGKALSSQCWWGLDRFLLLWRELDLHLHTWRL